MNSSNQTNQICVKMDLYVFCVGGRLADKRPGHGILECARDAHKYGAIDDELSHYTHWRRKLCNSYTSTFVCSDGVVWNSVDEYAYVMGHRKPKTKSYLTMILDKHRSLPHNVQVKRINSIVYSKFSYTDEMSNVILRGMMYKFGQSTELSNMLSLTVDTTIIHYARESHEMEGKLLMTVREGLEAYKVIVSRLNNLSASSNSVQYTRGIVYYEFYGVFHGVRVQHGISCTYKENKTRLTLVDVSGDLFSVYLCWYYNENGLLMTMLGTSVKVKEAMIKELLIICNLNTKRKYVSASIDTRIREESDIGLICLGLLGGSFEKCMYRVGNMFRCTLRMIEPL